MNVKITKKITKIVTLILFGLAVNCSGFTTSRSSSAARFSAAASPITKPPLDTTTTSRPQWKFNTRLPSYFPPSLDDRHLRRLYFLTAALGNNGDGSSPPISAIARAIMKFKARPGTYLTIPIIAAIVGWVTNWMAVQMIFYPIEFRGIPIYRRPEIPLGFLGWQGIVPCKTRHMSEAMVEMVTSQLLTVKEAFGKLDPRKVATLLAPEVPKLTTEILTDVLPLKWMVGLPAALFRGLDSASQAVIQHFTKDFLEQFTRAMQENIDTIFSLKTCVVKQMMQDRTMLGQLFWKCGQKELDFLTNSGLWFGFLLGIIQMFVALFWDNPWSLSIGGLIVGYATNWLALKWIFEPVDPMKIGPFQLQGQFLRRQKEVSAEFSKFFATRILTAEQLWKSVLSNPETRPAFASLFADHFTSFVRRITRGFRFDIEPETMMLATNKALEKLPDHVPVLYPYMDKTLALEDTLRVKMEKMTSRQFERVLHPIFEEDELTLVLAGAALGFAAGLIQQGLETGAISVPDLWTPLSTGFISMVTFLKQPRKQAVFLIAQVRSAKNRATERLRKPLERLLALMRRGKEPPIISENVTESNDSE